MAPYPDHSAVESPLHSPGSQRKKSLRVPAGSFLRLFLQLNRLEENSRFLFQPGMLFNDTLQWWGSMNRRPYPHEGLDICPIQCLDLSPDRVLPQMLVPALLSGQLVHFHSDFLGETLYIRHDQVWKEGAVLHTLYGHVAAIVDANTTGEQLSADHCCSSFLDRGQIVGAISSPPATCSVPAHLHISCAWIREEQQVEELNWENMIANANVLFIDPLPFLIQ